MWTSVRDLFAKAPSFKISQNCDGRNYRSSWDASHLSSNGGGFLDVLEAFCSTGRPDHRGALTVCHMDVRAGEWRDNRWNLSIWNPSKNPLCHTLTWLLGLPWSICFHFGCTRSDLNKFSKCDDLMWQYSAKTHVNSYEKLLFIFYTI